MSSEQHQIAILREWHEAKAQREALAAEIENARDVVAAMERVLSSLHQSLDLAAAIEVTGLWGRGNEKVLVGWSQIQTFSPGRLQPLLNEFRQADQRLADLRGKRAALGLD